MALMSGQRPARPKPCHPRKFDEITVTIRNFWSQDSLDLIAAYREIDEFLGLPVKSDYEYSKEFRNGL